MPPYSKSAFRAIPPTTRVTPELFYAYGKFNPDLAATKLSVASVALASNVASVVANLISGPPPVAGAIAGIRATVANPSVFNVDPTTLTGVVDNGNGNYTLTYAVANANIALAADSGEVAVLPYETPEALAVGASAPLALTFDSAELDGSRCVATQYTFTSVPTSATVVLQIADRDIDNRYYTYGTVATVAAGAVVQSGAQFQYVIGRFMRLAVIALTGSGAGVGTIFV